MPLNINGNILSSNVTNTSGVIQNYPTINQNGLVLWLDAGRSQSYYDVNYYDCGYGCQYYASNPGCTNCNSQWTDLSSSACRGQFINGPTFSFNNGGAIVFDGVNDYVQINNFTFNSKPTSQITVDAWIKPTRSSVGTGTIRGGVISATSNMYFGVIDSVDGGATMSLHWANNTTGARSGGANGSIPNNAWSYISGTWDGTTTRGYINGVEVYTFAQTGTIPDATYVVGTYGAGLTDGVHNFNGHIAIARIYRRGLSVAELLQNYNAERGRFGL